MAARLLLGLDSYSYHYAAPVWGSKPAAPLTVEGYLERAADLGVDGLELADMRHFPSTDPAILEPLRARARDRGLYVELGTGGVDFDHLRQTLRLAKWFGTSVVRTFVSIGRTWGGQEHYAAGLERVVAGLRRIAPVCDEAGVALAIENHQDLTAGELVELLDAVAHPLIGVCWDTGNSLGVLEHPLEGLELVADRVWTVHLKSYAVLPHFGGKRASGYCLLGVPVRHNLDMLRRAMAILAARSPASQLHVNVESALEHIPVVPQRPGWREEHVAAAERIVEALGVAPSRVSELRQEWAPWVVRPDSRLDEILSLEDRLVRRSVREARGLVGSGAGASG
jgi:sugar phosphate isomerase/epimerase